MSIPRALVINPVLDGRSIAEALDFILTNITITGMIEAQIRNTATLPLSRSRSGSGHTVYLLYDFLDKGTQPHFIGESEAGQDRVLLANKSKDFGPVWGPVHHPGTRPYDISARTEAYFQSQLESNLFDSAGNNSSALANRLTEELPWAALRRAVVASLQNAVRFSKDITPDTWQQVKDAYQLYVNGRQQEF